MKKTLFVFAILLSFFLPKAGFCMSAEDFVVSDQVDDHDKHYFYARMIVADMTLEEKAAQLFIIDPDAVCENGNPFELTEDGVNVFASLTPGGVMIRGKNIKSEEQLRSFCVDMQMNANINTGIPLFIAAEEEGGYVERVAMKLGLTGTSSMGELGDSGHEEDAYYHGKALGERLWELGINMNFAPFAVIGENLETDTIAQRHIGNDAQTVANLSSQIIAGMQEQHVSAVMKYFPTENRTDGTIDDSIYRLKEEASLPYVTGIRNGLGFILVANQPIKELTDHVPASMSDAVCTDWLREELRFEGVIISDLLTDEQVVSQYGRNTALLQAFNAGCDMFLLTEDYPETVDVMVQAIKRGEITEERLNRSVVRIVAGKIISGMIE